MFGFFWIPIIAVILASVIRINKEWDRAVILQLGRFSRIAGAGIFLVLPGIEEVIKRDTRVRTMDLIKQQVITKDNVSIMIDAVAFTQIKDVKKSIVEVRDLDDAVYKCAQTALRNVVGEVNLDNLLTDRAVIADKVKSIVDTKVDEWGVDIKSIELQNIIMPESMERVMARQAEAEREKRGVVIASKGELEAAINLRKASEELVRSKHGYSLRVLQTLSDVSQDQSNTVVFFPTEALDSSMVGAGLAARIPKPKAKTLRK